jgi:hypothetical protein
MRLVSFGDAEWWTGPTIGTRVQSFPQRESVAELGTQPMIEGELMR